MVKKQWKGRLFHTDAWVKKIESGGASSVPPDSFLIGPDLYSSHLDETPYCPFSSNGNERLSGFGSSFNLPQAEVAGGAPILASKRQHYWYPKRLGHSNTCQKAALLDPFTAEK